MTLSLLARMGQDGGRVAQPRKDWYALCVRSGLRKIIEKHYEGLQMHDLRRSAVGRTVRRCVPEKICVSSRGHKTRSVFDSYNITNERDLEQAANLLEPGRQVSVSETKADALNFAHS